MKGAIAAIVFSVASVAAQEKPQAVVNEITVAGSIRRGVDFLIAKQNPNGSWGGPTRTKGLNIYAPLPGAHHAFRAGASGLALSGLIDSGDTRPETLAAIAKGAAWMESELPKLRRADQTTTYNAWGHAYGMRALARLYKIAKTDEDKEKWKRLAQEQCDLVNRYMDLNGGWGYLDIYDGLTTQKPTGITTSFTTATVLLAMREARDVMGIKLDDRIVKASLASVERQRTPDFSYVYSHSHIYRPRVPINRPAGSLARSQACNATLRAFGDDKVTDEVINTWANRFIEREGFLSIGRKRPVPHETHFQISGYFYYYGVFYFTQSVEFLPAIAQKEHAQKLATLILFRQEKDGSWWDYPLYDYHQPYGTGYALMALSWCRDKMGMKPQPE
ncbi:terpene cyclase/mutase family protein [Haloferula sp. BvORR071]|uniref:terpene cyclase/mutase family protein n=1 Tax=Haloferula sp. BvORR071 TaxID=1396141 RepID=UPI000696FCE2|nr:terpene cyclase/mutase family protein [Haloferula sp. BvORR071]